MTLDAIALVLLAAGPPAEAIIDVHLHCYASDPRWDARIGNPVTGQKMTATDEAAHRAATFAAMERAHIVKAVVSGNHDAALRWKEAAPEKVIIGYDFDDPTKVDLEFVRKEHAAGRLDVLGEGGPQYEGIGPDDPRMEPVYALAEELDIPLALHMHPGPPGATSIGFPKIRPSLGNPLRLEEVLFRHPKLRLYIMHAAWPFLDELMALMHSYPSVYVDLGVIDWTRPPREFHHYLRRLVQGGFGRRIMFGSDQMVWPETIEIAIQSIESADFLSAEQKRDIFFNNAARFLQLSPEQSSAMHDMADD